MQGGRIIKEIRMAQRVNFGIHSFVRGVQFLDMRYANRPNIIMKPWQKSSMVMILFPKLPDL